jgi:hypothetical protein
LTDEERQIVHDATTRMLHGLVPNTVRLIGTTVRAGVVDSRRVPDGLMPEQVRGLLEQTGGLVEASVEATRPYKPSSARNWPSAAAAVDDHIGRALAVAAYLLRERRDSRVVDGGEGR